MSKSTILDSTEVLKLIDHLAEAFIDSVPQGEHFSLVGLANGGVSLAAILEGVFSKRYALNVPVGTIDISFYRDDFSTRPVGKIKFPTDLPFNIDGNRLFLVDDVLESGRTVRAALTEIFDQGRPEWVRFATLIDRGNRILPIQPDFVGKSIDVPKTKEVRVSLDPKNLNRNAVVVC